MWASHSQRLEIRMFTSHAAVEKRWSKACASSSAAASFIASMNTSPASSRFGRTADPAEPPCDFDVFVAQRRGINREQAQRLIQSWLTHYRPLKIREAQSQDTSGTACASSPTPGKENEKVAPGPPLDVASSCPL